MNLLDVIANKEIKSSEKILLIYLNEVIGANNELDLRLDDISLNTGLSRPTVVNAARKLTELGYIYTKRNICPYGSIRPNTYVLLRGKINDKN